MTEHKRPGMVDADNHVLRDENEADRNDGKRVAPSLALASAVFLVLEGIVCFFSQRTDPWHGYLWFALMVLLGVAVLLVTAFRSSLYESTASFFRNSLGLLYAAHVFMALIFAAGLWSVGQDNAGSVVLIAVVDCSSQGAPSSSTGSLSLPLTT